MKINKIDMIGKIVKLRGTATCTILDSILVKGDTNYLVLLDSGMIITVLPKDIIEIMN